MATSSILKSIDLKNFSFFAGDYVTHIIPLMTQPFDFRKRKSVVPRWEELLLFNEDFDYFMSYGTNLVGIFHPHLIMDGAI